jgi:hypothetical protein
MSTQYPGGIISKTAPVPSGPYSNSTAPGIWTLEQQAAYAKLGQWPTAGNVNPSAFIENLFSTYLYAGSNSSQTITNGIDLSTNGGLVWTKARTTTYNNQLTDTVRGGNKQMATNNQGSNSTSSPAEVSSFNTDGYTLAGGTVENVAGQDFVGWTFREQAKFFDIVTYTGNGAASRNISHALGSKPGFVVIKRTDVGSDWWVAAWNGTTFWVGLDSSPFAFNSTNGYNTPNGAAATTTTFDPNEVTISSSYGVTPSSANTNGGTYIAYLFAHNAGGFGLSGSENVISCGSFVTVGSGKMSAPVNLGYEPQWLLIKNASSAENWAIYDTVRGISYSGYKQLYPSSSAAEASSVTALVPTATGFDTPNAGGPFANSSDYIYIAIRKGPMAVPTTATSVYQANAYTGNATNNTTVAGNFGFPVDTMLFSNRDATALSWSSYGQIIYDRLRGADFTLGTAQTSQVSGWTTYNQFDRPNTVGWGLYGADSGTDYLNKSGATFVARGIRRAPKFHDIVVYVGTGTNRTVTHNLGVAPELILIKNRSAATSWVVYCAPLTATQVAVLNNNSAPTTNPFVFLDTEPTSTVFTVGASTSGANGSGNSITAYLFATCPGVSKVGSYTGTGTTQVINCGFTAGSRFVMIKRTDGTGDWYIWDSARGIVPGNDPYLLANSTAAEVTGTDYVDTAASGFEISSTAPAEINANGGNYIFLAIA